MKTLLITASGFYEERITDVLKEQDCEIVATVRTGKDAIIVYKQRNPQLVIVDVVLPERSGFEIAKDILNDSSDVKILMLSDLKTRSSIEEAMRSGARDLLIKPFSDAEFRSTLQVFIDEIED